MRKTLQVALSCVLIIGWLSTPCLGGDNGVYPAASRPVGGEICFPLPDGERILRDLESLAPCREAVVAGEDALSSSIARATALEARVLEQDRELKEALKLVDDTRKAGEEAAKVAAGPWYARILSAGKWIALGIIVGFVGGMGK